MMHERKYFTKILPIFPIINPSLNNRFNSQQEYNGIIDDIDSNQIVSV